MSSRQIGHSIVFSILRVQIVRLFFITFYLRAIIISPCSRKSVKLKAGCLEKPKFWKSVKWCGWGSGMKIGC